MRIKSLLIHIAIVIFLITNSTFVLAKQPTYQVLGNNINNDCSDGGSPYTLIFSSKPTLETVPFGKCTATAVYENGKRYGGDNFAFFIGSVVITRLPDKDDGNDDKDDNGDKNNNNDSGNSNNNNNDNKNSNSNNNNNPPPPAPTPSTPPPTPNPTPSKPPPTPDPTPSTPPPTPTPTPSKEADSCALLHPETETPGTLLQAANLLSSILPQTPDNMRLPTLISQMGGQGSLAGNLGLEIYSAAWQYLSIIAFIKFYKLIPGKMS